MTHEEIFATLKTMIADQFGVSEGDVTLATSYDDLGADSVDLVELSMSMEDEFGLSEELSEDDVASLKTVGDTVNFLVSKLNA